MISLTLTAKHNENGMVTKTRRIDRKVIKCAHKPGPSSHAAKGKQTVSWSSVAIVFLIHIMHIWFSELNLPLVSSKNLTLSKNGSCLKVSQKELNFTRRRKRS